MVKGHLFRTYIDVFNPDTGNGITGLTDDDFTYTILVNGPVSSETLSIFEVDAVSAAGEYEVQHTALVLGDRKLKIVYPALEMEWSGIYDVTEAEVDDLARIDHLLNANEITISYAAADIPARNVRKGKPDYMTKKIDEINTLKIILTYDTTGRDVVSTDITII